MDDLAQLLNQPEGRMLEFKRDLSSRSGVLKTLVAFANTAGGALVVGREDDGHLCGMPDIQSAEERLANLIADSIHPALLPDIEPVHREGVDLLIVRVARWPGPFYLKSQGPEQGVYIRLGSTNRRAGSEALAELRRAASHLVFDRLPCVGTELDDLDMEAARRAFQGVDRQIDATKLESLGVLTRHGRHLLPSNGGIILFGRPEIRRQFFPDARVRCARFAGTDKVEFLDRLDLESTVLDAIEEVPRFIRRNTRLAGRIEGMRRQDLAEYSPVALREVLVNAVVHTDYTLRGMQIMVAIFSDRLEIQNPGMLPFGLTLEDLKAGVSRIRNPVIARVFRELDLMEEWGSGYRRITAACDRRGYPYPEWTELGSAIRVGFQPHPEVVSLPEALLEDQVGTKSGPSRDQVQFLEFARDERSLVELMELVDAHNRTKFRNRFIRPLLDADWLAMTIPDKPRSSKQRYLITEKGLQVLQAIQEK